MEARWYLARRELRERLAAILVLTVLVAVVVATVLACATAARRSHTALDRLRESLRASDETLLTQDLDLAEQIAELPVLDDAAVLVLQWMFPAESDAFLPVVADPGGRWLHDLDRVTVVDGALPPPDDPDAVVLTSGAAEVLGLHAGDELPMQALTQDEADEAEQSGTLDFSFEGPELTLEVAAVVELPPINDDPSGQLMSVLTPAFLERHGDEIPTFGALVQVRLRPGATTADLSAALDELPGGDQVQRDAAGTGGIDAARTALDTVALGLGLLAAAAALAGLVVTGQAVARIVLSASDDASLLVAMGLSPRGAIFLLSVAPVVATVTGVVLGGLVAPFVAPHLIGDFARRVDPRLGTTFDWTVLGVGALVALALLLGVAVVAAVVVQRRPHRRRRSTTRPGPAAVAAGAGLPSAVVAGLALASPRAGRRVPTRQALASAAVGVVGLVAVAVFGSSLDRTLEEPIRFGWGWDATVAVDQEVDPAELDRRGVTDAAMVTTNLPLTLAGEPVPGTAIDPVRGRIEPILVRGDRPSGSGDVLVGEKTLDDLGLALGDEVTAQGPAGEAQVRIVGTTLFASPGDPLPLARGAVIDPSLVEELGISGEGSPELAVVVDGDPREALADLAEQDLVSFPSPPVEIGRLEDVRQFPTVLAGFLGLLAAFGVGQLAFILTRRRRRDLATLRALGFTRRQVRLAVLSQATGVVLVGLAVGIPLGLVVGRVGWLSLTRSLGLPFRPDVPVGWLLGLVVAIFVVALVASAPGAVASARVRLASALRTE